MTISKPFHHMYRGDASGLIEEPFVEAQHSPAGHYHLSAYTLLTRDAERLFEFIEPRAANSKAFSHRTYELLLRCSAEIESNLRTIFIANGRKQTKKDRWDIKRYSDLEGPMRLSQYEVGLSAHEFPPFRPFSTFASGLAREKRVPPWYRAYDEAKDNRAEALEQASFENVLGALGGLYVLLGAQYAIFDYKLIRQNKDDCVVDLWDTIFYMSARPTWEPDSDPEAYAFDWRKLKKQANPYQNHQIPLIF